MLDTIGGIIGADWGVSDAIDADIAKVDKIVDRRAKVAFGLDHTLAGDDPALYFNIHFPVHDPDTGLGASLGVPSTASAPVVVDGGIRSHGPVQTATAAPPPSVAVATSSSAPAVTLPDILVELDSPVTVQTELDGDEIALKTHKNMMRTRSRSIGDNVQIIMP